MFRKLIKFEEAKRLIVEKTHPETLGTEEASLLDAHNRVLSENLISTFDIPPFNRSTVDGYAVNAIETFDAQENEPVMLNVCGTVNVGEPPKISIGKGEAAEIVTGAPIPDGADAVVMVEDTDVENGVLRVYRVVTKDENVMKKGSDIRKSKTVLKAGQVLGASEIGVLAALGLIKSKVFTMPLVAVLSTGAEIIEPGKALPAGKIYDINAYSLSTAVWQSGGKPVYLGVVPDDKAELQKALKHALSLADIVLTSGGVSVGPKDLTPQIVNSLGEPGVIFSGIAVKPGKPTTFALVGRKPIFALPGHPTSALLMFHLLVRPIVQLMSGRSLSEVKTVKAFAGTRLFAAKGRQTFVMVRLERDKLGRLLAHPVETGASGAITTLAKAQGFVQIPENQLFIDVAEEVVVTFFESAN